VSAARHVHVRAARDRTASTLGDSKTCGRGVPTSTVTTGSAIPIHLQNELTCLLRGAMSVSPEPPAAVQEDPRSVGLMFIDFLFAFVISKIFELSTNAGLAVHSYSHLAVAATVTIASWIGYRSSNSRRSYRITFFNLPLVQLSVELAHLYLYWLLATTAERLPTFSTSSAAPSLLPESLVLLGIFALYAAWDRIALSMRRSDRYPGLSLTEDRPRRRVVTKVFSVAICLFTIVIAIVSPHTELAVLAGDVFLILFVIGHRAAQNYADECWGLARRLAIKTWKIGQWWDH
jgi:hypothetical protein